MSRWEPAFHPVMERWFAQRYGVPTEPQALGWPKIRSGQDVLICAPTGSGKTLAAFSICLDALLRRAERGALGDGVLAVYVSPLKALTNDIHKNLEVPLAELAETAAESGIDVAAIRTAVRTGDTEAAARRAMLRTPPHVLVTTPESLYILLTAERTRALFERVETVIVDEIHAVAADKRGAHLALTLARLDDVVHGAGGSKPQRIGLSATLQPIDAIAGFLSPTSAIVEVGRRRHMDLAVAIPNDELGPVASGEMWADVYDQITEIVRAHRTTLIFVATRRMSERVAFALAERLGEDAVLPHHGSLSRELRFTAETRLKSGTLKAVVATASLELGIDIGSVDVVVQIGSPRSIAIALQRIGRSGHWVGAHPKGILVATTRDELLECAAVVRALRAGRMDAIAIPRYPLDILAQQIVATVAQREWGLDELYDLARDAAPYRSLSRSDFDDAIAMLSEGVATSRGRSGTFLHVDRVNGRVRARRGARLAAITCGGAIPDVAAYNVVLEPEGQIVGTLDEDFAIESMAGDVFLLGTNSWRIRRVESGVVRVEDAHGAPPTIPFWNGEGPGRTLELSEDVCAVRVAIDARDDIAARAWLAQECALDAGAADQLIDYVRTGKAVLGVVPTQQTIVAERFFDEAGGMQLILHTPFGARINRAWGLALRKRFCRSFNLELQAAATDNGVLLSLSDQHAFPLDSVFEFVKSASAEYVLTQALLPAPMFGARWRWNATRALAILRMRGGKKVPPQIMRMRADDLLASVFPDQAACPENLTGPIRIPDHLLVRETIANCLYEAMDFDGFLRVLTALEAGEIRTVAIDTPEPSAFAHEILNSNPYAYLDDAPLEERRARAVQLRRTARPDADGTSILDAEAIATVAAQSWPVVRDADELHDALCTLGVANPSVAWQAWFEELAAQRRAAVARIGAARVWVCAERWALARVAYPDIALETPLAELSGGSFGDDAAVALAEIVRGWMESSGPLTVAQLSATIHVDDARAEAALLRLESEGQVLRGTFGGGDAGQWCNRRVLARIHRMTLGQLRRDIEAVSSADYARFLQRWQHVLPTARLHGLDGTLLVIRQLEGYEIPAAAWESQILPARVAGYRPDFLDRLCYSGEVMWGRLCPHPALEADAGESSRRVRPTKLAPIALFARSSADELLVRRTDDPAGLSHVAREVLAEIAARGAPFFAEIARASKRLPSEIEEALWQLVAAGLVTADGFDALRSLIDAKRRLGAQGQRARPRASSGRWTLLTGNRDAIDADAFARRLLARWGVVFRDVVLRETLAPRWRDLLVALRRMEARGEIRGGRFVAGFVGEQFALPEAVDSLRAVRRAGGDAESVRVGAFDPLNLGGAIAEALAPVASA